MDASIRAVMFDAVGTLIRPARDVHEVYAAAGRRYGSRYDASSIQTRFRRALAASDHHRDTNERHQRALWRRIVAEVFDDVPDAAEALFAELWDHFAAPRHWRLYDDVRPTWECLRQRDLVVGIASNFDARLDAIRCGLPPLDGADHLFYSSAIGFSKPRTEFYSSIQARLGIPARRILMVGDNRANDVTAARAAGWQAVWLRRDRCGNTNAEAGVVRTLTEVFS